MVGQEQEGRVEVGLNKKLDKLIEVLEPKKKSKRIKLPKLKKAKLKQNYALVIYIKDNLSIEMEYLKIENEYIYIRKTNSYHLATSKYIMNYKGIPTIVQPTWSLEPFCPSKNYDETIAANKGANPQKILITLMEQSSLKLKKKLGGGKGMIILVVGIVAVLYFISKLLGKG